MQTSDLVDLLDRRYRVDGLRTRSTMLANARHLLRLLPALPTLDDIEDYKAERRDEGAAPATIANELSVLRCAFREAVRLGKLDSAPRFRAPRVENTRTTSATPEQVAELVRGLDLLDPDVADGVRWVLLCGWRRRQVFGLRWADVADDLSSVTVPQASTKSRRVHRVTLGDSGRSLLERRRGLRRCSHVFARARGPIREFRGSWIRAAQFAGCPGFVFHDLRRVFATLAVESGVPERVAMSLAGWQSRSIFARYCLDVSSSAQAQGADVMARQFDQPARAVFS